MKNKPNKKFQRYIELTTAVSHQINYQNNKEETV